MKNIAFLCDSSADISQEEAQALDLHVLRMPVIVDNEVFTEEETIQTPQIIEALRANKKVTTTQPSIGEMVEMWRKLLETYDEIFYLPLSLELSGTCRNAIQLAQEEEFQGKVVVVESRYVCYPVVKQLEAARKLFAQGYDAITIKNKIEKESELFAILIPENLQTLKNGGRISPAAAKLAGLLKIFPLLKVENGAIDIHSKVRTLSKAYKEGIKACIEGIQPKDYDWMVIDADNKKMSNELKVLLEEATGQFVEQRDFKSIIMSHTGVGTIGFGRIKKIK